MNLKTGVTRKQSTTNFQKNKHFLPSDTHTYVCVSGGKKCSFFGKLGVLFSCNTRFEIRSFALLPTIYQILLRLSLFPPIFWVMRKTQYFFPRDSILSQILVKFVYWKRSWIQMISHLSSLSYINLMKIGPKPS